MMDNNWINFSLFGIALVAVVASAPFYIHYLRQRTLGQYIREDGPQQHHSKAGTPTGGGILILFGVLAGVLAAAIVERGEYLTEEVWVVLGVTFALGVLGFADDALKIFKKKNKGVSGYTKLAIQALAGLAVGLYMMQAYKVSDVTVFNFCRWELGWFYPLFAMLVVIATSNAVNLTDGLDGLAASTTFLSFFAMAKLFGGGATFSFQNVAHLFSMNPETASLAFSKILDKSGFLVPVAAVYPDLSLLCYILMGAVMGFLFFNLNPAKLFMGDTGSLALGGAIAAMAIIGQMEFWLFLIGGVFVLEALSVLIQVVSYKTTGKRVFKMAPLHHHFELCGLRETHVVMLFSLIQLVLCVAAVLLYNMTL